MSTRPPAIICRICSSLTRPCTGPTRPAANCVTGAPNRTDCRTEVAAPYTGPIPLVTHVHGAHVQPHSDGYPEAWWLPGANNIPAGYSLRGSRYGQADSTNAVPGSAFFSYENTQPAATLWYHDHALGMTRLNVYAGPAGFWLVRGGANDTASAGVLPGPAPAPRRRRSELQRRGPRDHPRDPDRDPGPLL